MPYLTDPKEIKTAIAHYTRAKRLWVDTEVADYRSKKPRLSLIQVADDPSESLLHGSSVNILDLPEVDNFADRVSLLDVLDRPELTEFFIGEIMENPAIEKVFHNASYDLKWLGKKKAVNVTCTLEMAKQLPLFLLQTSNFQLKTLAVELCELPPVGLSQQQSDWGRRPLSETQVEYAMKDPVYLAYVHLRLLEIQSESRCDPGKEDIAELSDRYVRLKRQVQLMDSEVNYLEERLKQAMQVQRVKQTDRLKLSSSQRSTYKTPFSHLAKLVQECQLDLDFPVTLTKQMRGELGELGDRLPLEEQKTTSWRLTVRQPEDEEEG